jgi:magnesium transporter
MTTNPLYLPELREMIQQGNEEELREFCEALHPARTAEFMDGLDPEEIWEVLRHTDLQNRVAIFGFFEPELQVGVLEVGPAEEMAQFVAHLPPDDRVDVLQSSSPERVRELMPLIPVEERRDIQRLRSFPESMAGAEMTTEFVRLRESMTVEESLGEISRQTEKMETVYYLYIVDDNDHLVGLVSARQLLASIRHPKTRVGEIMERDLITVNAYEDREEAAQKVARFDLLAIPVVDEEHRMLGIITHDDVLDVMVDELTEDAQRSAAVEPLEESYMGTPLLTLVKKRLLWLMILFFGALLTAFALDEYESVTQAIPWLVIFIPLVISTGGNSGGQSAALIITALSKNEITSSDWLRILVREVLMGTLLGFVLGAVGYLCALLFAPGGAGWYEFLVIPITLLLVVILGTITGSGLPLLFRKIGWDPAMMSNPFVAGLLDVGGILIFMKLAMWILRPELAGSAP